MLISKGDKCKMRDKTQQGAQNGNETNIKAELIVNFEARQFLICKLKYNFVCVAFPPVSVKDLNRSLKCNYDQLRQE